MKETQININQKRFVDSYLVSGNIKDAAIKAGYGEKNAKVVGCSLLKKPHIKKYLDEKMESLQKKEIATASEVLKYLTKVIRGEYKEEIARGQRIEISTKDRIKACELLAKRYGLFKEQIDVTLTKPSDILADIIKQLNEEKGGESV